MGDSATTAATTAARLALMGFDVDSVLTDGTLCFGPRGGEMKLFSSLDSHGLRMLQRADIGVTVISGRGAVRGVNDLILRAQDKRDAVMAECLA